MHYNKTIEEAKRTIEAIKLIAPDINTGDHKPEELVEEMDKGEAHELHMDNLHGQVSAGVATRYANNSRINEINNGIIHGVRASKHPKRDELLRFLGYKLAWEFGSGSSEVIPLPPSGEAPAAA